MALSRPLEDDLRFLIPAISGTATVDGMLKESGWKVDDPTGVQ